MVQYGSARCGLYPMLSWDSPSQNSTAQYSAAQRSAAQHSTEQHSTAQHSIAQHSTVHLLTCRALSVPARVHPQRESSRSPVHPRATAATPSSVSPWQPLRSSTWSSSQNRAQAPRVMTPLANGEDCALCCAQYCALGQPLAAAKVQHLGLLLLHRRETGHHE